LSAVAGFVCRVPVRIHTFTGQTWFGHTGVARFVYWSVDWLINWLNHACLTDSFSQSEFLAQNKITYRGAPLPVLSFGSLSGVDLMRFNRLRLELAAADVRRNLKLQPGDFLFALIARKTIEKGAVDLLNAFSQLIRVKKNAHLLFLGPDEDGEIERLHKINPQWFENVHEVGAVHNHEEYLAATDVLCVPSYREGFGSVVIEAAAMGVPTIGSRIPGLIDSVVDGQTGLLFDAGNVQAFSQGMLRLHSEPLLCQSLGANAKQRAEAYFSADVLYDALKSFYVTEFDRVKR
jgi:glycosyltransferase involved in cell wall biosynthesis